MIASGACGVAIQRDDVRLAWMPRRWAPRNDGEWSGGPHDGFLRSASVARSFCAVSFTQAFQSDGGLLTAPISSL